MEIDTPYFSGVSPLWVTPGKPEIAERYHEAVLELAKWAGPDWADNKKTNFFMIRQVVIQSIDAWSNYDWDQDRRLIDERKDDVRQLRKAKGLPQILRSLVGSDRFKSLKIRFVTAILAHLKIEIPTTLRNGDCFDAFDRGFGNLADAIEAGDQFSAKYGAIEYDQLPRSLPRIRVAIALCIADRITLFRRDGYSKGTLVCPHPPSLSPDLPWKAIALFASANTGEVEATLEEANVQTLVESLAKSAKLIRWTP